LPSTSDGRHEKRIAAKNEITGYSHTKNIVRGAFAAAAIAAALPAVAADLPAKGPAMAPAPTYMEAFDPYMIRIRGVAVVPDSGKGNIAAGVLVGGQVKAKEAYIPELDLTYFFTKNIAVEAICCFTRHNIKGSGALAGIGNVGSTWIFPPTVMLQYHFTGMGAFKPYVGVGVNYSVFFNEKARGALAAVPANLRIGNSWGVAGQVGFDYMLNRNWGINFDVKRIMMEPKFSSFTPAGVLVASGKAKINPWLIGAGITYRFGGSSAVVAKY
jgi:outer membrane protein